MEEKKTKKFYRKKKETHLCKAIKFNKFLFFKSSTQNFSREDQISILLKDQNPFLCTNPSIW